jgi:Uma2 family endonuclease
MVAEKRQISEKKIPIKRTPKVPDYLIWEVLDGQPLYRRGYKDVLRKLKTLEDIMGTSSFQSILNSYIYRLLVQNLDENRYDILTGEPGLHLEKNDNISNDIVVHELLPAHKITTKYANYPPKLVVEIDIEIDPDSMPEIEYLQKKTSKMLEFGVERVVWILTYVKTVIVADRERNTWYMVDWASDIELLEGITFNIQQFLDKRGINPDTMKK